MPAHKPPVHHVKVFFIVTIIALGIAVSVFMIDNAEKIIFISRQNKQIGDLIQVVSSQKNKIDGLVENVNWLESNVTFLNANLAKKAKDILSLNRELGKTEVELEVAKTEIDALTPTVRNYFAVGVNSDGDGVVIPMNVKVSKGSGILSVNIKGVDLQSGATASVRLASQIASRKTGVDLSKKDLTVSFVNNQDELVILDGPSAGAAITITMIATLQEREMDTESMMTGTIEANNAIGRVGSVGKKAQAAKEYGSKVFYVPSGEAVNINGIQLIELNDIDDAIDLVLKGFAP